MSALTLPGDIPGLLRRGSPVVLATRTYGGSVFLDGARGVVCSDGGRVGTETLGGSPVLVSTSPRDLALDLTDATGRAHAAWWLAKSTAGVWRSVDGYVWTDGDRLYDEVDVPALRAVMGQEAHCRALPDGSMWRDAEALRLVCLHVAGRAP